ncbi:hypothetical protein [Bacillus toyonensis]|uniref:hypothetical protein n=1 Tax=Bacillus toyonensis TaxID=155322 RepID=UPI000BFAA776|nr:hypothetical protein [Bacillus toyonensis]PGC04398.1 hypothetical protein COM19_02355 [Bacillus toyonensis]
MQQSKKRCPQCKKYKDLDQFHECKSNFDGLQGRCKPCNNRTRNTNKKTLIIPVEIDGEMIDHRYCKTCEELKPLDQFFKNGRGGRKAHCKPCHIEKVKKSKAIREALKNNRPDQAKAIA